MLPPLYPCGEFNITKYVDEIIVTILSSKITKYTQWQIQEEGGVFREPHTNIYIYFGGELTLTPVSTPWNNKYLNWIRHLYICFYRIPS